jgi:hypothetical protein
VTIKPGVGRYRQIRKSPSFPQSQAGEANLIDVETNGAASSGRRRFEGEEAVEGQAAGPGRTGTRRHWVRAAHVVGAPNELTVLLREGRAAVDSRGGARQPEEDDGIAGIRVPEQELRHESYVSGLCEAVHLRFEGNADREDGPWSEFE